jgi:competence protein ComEC
LSCDGLGCLYRPPSGHVVALPKHADALADDCRRADVLVADLWLPRACVGPQIKIGRRERRDNGGHALWFEGGEVRVEAVGDQRNGRPWGGRR